MTISPALTGFGVELSLSMLIERPSGLEVAFGLGFGPT